LIGREAAVSEDDSDKDRRLGRVKVWIIEDGSEWEKGWEVKRWEICGNEGFKGEVAGKRVEVGVCFENLAEDWIEMKLASIEVGCGFVRELRRSMKKKFSLHVENGIDVTKLESLPEFATRNLSNFSC
jgi:hypothetical protein